LLNYFAFLSLLKTTLANHKLVSNHLWYTPTFYVHPLHIQSTSPLSSLPLVSSPPLLRTVLSCSSGSQICSSTSSSLLPFLPCSCNSWPGSRTTCIPNTSCLLFLLILILFWRVLTGCWASCSGCHCTLLRTLCVVLRRANCCYEKEMYLCFAGWLTLFLQLQLLTTYVCWGTNLHPARCLLPYWLLP